MRKDDLTEKQNREAGFTLLEVIIAISILTVGLLAVGLTRRTQTKDGAL